MCLREAAAKHSFILFYLSQCFQLVQYLLLTQRWRIRWSEMLRNKTNNQKRSKFCFLMKLTAVECTDH